MMTLHQSGPESRIQSWSRHQIVTYSALLALCEGNHQLPVDSPHKGQWGGALMFSMMSAWTSIWANNRDAGDLRRHHAHYDVTVMVKNIEIKHFIGEIASRVVVCDCVAAIFLGRLLNSSWTSDVIWPQRSGSTSHYLNEAITWTNIDWSSVKSSGIHFGAISLDKPQPPNTEIRLKITYLEFHLNFPRGQWVGVFFRHGILDMQPVSAAMSKSVFGWAS